MSSVFRHSLGCVAKRIAKPVGQGSAQILKAPSLQSKAFRPVYPILRPFSTLGNTLHRLPTVQKILEAGQPSIESNKFVDLARTPAVVAQTHADTVMKTMESQPAEETAKLHQKAMVFEIGFTFCFLHYQSIFIGVMRCLFQSFRPLLILFIFGQLIKAFFFIAGAPIWFSFYSIWLFEVGYGLAQCAISFIFISFFYNNLSFARVRPSLSYLFRQQREKLSRAAGALSI